MPSFTPYNLRSKKVIASFSSPNWIARSSLSYFKSYAILGLEAVGISRHTQPGLEKCPRYYSWNGGKNPLGEFPTLHYDNNNVIVTSYRVTFT